MTPTEQAARWLADVQIQYFDTKQAETPSGRLLPEQWMPASEVVSAIARHLAPGDDAVLIDALLNEPGFDKDWREAAAARIAALTATVALLRADRDSAARMWQASEQDKEAAERDAADLRNRLTKDAKAHEKEIAVWDENYAALRDRLARMEGALTFYRNGFERKVNRTKTGLALSIEYLPTPALLDDCGNRALDALDAALTDGGSNG